MGWGLGTFCSVQDMNYCLKLFVYQPLTVRSSPASVFPSRILHNAAAAEITGLPVVCAVEVANSVLPAAVIASLAVFVPWVSPSAAAAASLAYAVAASLARAGSLSLSAASSYVAPFGWASLLAPLCLPAGILAFAVVAAAVLADH